jgi:hypothetical protein
VAAPIRTLGERIFAFRAKPLNGVRDAGSGPLQGNIDFCCNWVAGCPSDSGFGLTKGADGFLSWSVLPLRLTASGHQFIEALSNKEVWATIKHSFKDVSIETLRSVALKLLDGYATKKIDALLS